MPQIGSISFILLLFIFGTAPNAFAITYATQAIVFKSSSIQTGRPNPPTNSSCDGFIMKISYKERNRWTEDRRRDFLEQNLNREISGRIELSAFPSVHCAAINKNFSPFVSTGVYVVDSQLYSVLCRNSFEPGGGCSVRTEAGVYNPSSNQLESLELFYINDDGDLFSAYKLMLNGDRYQTETSVSGDVDFDYVINATSESLDFLKN